MPMPTANNTMTWCLASLTLTVSWTLILVVLFRVLPSYWVGSCVLALQAPVSTQVSQSSTDAECVASTEERSARPQLTSLLIDNLGPQLLPYIMYLIFQC